MSAYNQFLNDHFRRPLLVDVKPVYRNAGSYAGFLADFGKDLLLMELFDWDTFRLNGFAVLRHDGIKSFRAWDDLHDWPYPVLKKRRIRSSKVPKIDLSSTAGAAVSAAKLFPLITVHCQRKFPDECWIGRKPVCNRAHLTFEPISAMAEWEAPYRIPLRDITAIEVGGGYEQALFDCASAA